MSALITSLEKRLADGKDDVLLRFGLGSAYVNEKQYEKALVHLEACIEQQADYSAAYKLLAKTLIALDRKDSAAEILATGIPIAEAQGDKQSVREMMVFKKRLEKDR